MTFRGAVILTASGSLFSIELVVYLERMIL